MPSVVIETKVKGEQIATGMTKDLVDDVATLVGVSLFVVLLLCQLHPGREQYIRILSNSNMPVK